MLKLLNISKSYDKNDVLENIVLEIKEGELFGIIGPNGSGKTTLLNIIMNRINYKGDVIINSLPNHKFIEHQRDQILYVKDQPILYDYLTGLEFIRFVLDMRKIQFAKVKERVEILLNLFDMNDFKNHLIRDYSLGMKKKIYLMPILIQKPKILILDEPVAGFDSKSIIILKRVLQSLVNEGSVIIFSTNVLDLIPNLCDRIGILYDKHLTIFNDIISLEKTELEQIYLNHIHAEIDSLISKFVKLY